VAQQRLARVLVVGRAPRHAHLARHVGVQGAAGGAHSAPDARAADGALGDALRQARRAALLQAHVAQHLAQRVVLLHVAVRAHAPRRQRRRCNRSLQLFFVRIYVQQGQGAVD